MFGNLLRTSLVRGQFSNYVYTIIENICSVPNLRSVLEFVCDHQQAPAMKLPDCQQLLKTALQTFSPQSVNPSSSIATINCKQTNA